MEAIARSLPASLLLPHLAPCLAGIVTQGTIVLLKVLWVRTDTKGAGHRGRQIGWTDPMDIDTFPSFTVLVKGRTASAKCDTCEWTDVGYALTVMSQMSEHRHDVEHQGEQLPLYPVAL